jgi:hypothetical protein
MLGTSGPSQVSSDIARKVAGVSLDRKPRVTIRRPLRALRSIRYGTCPRVV